MQNAQFSFYHFEKKYPLIADKPQKQNVPHKVIVPQGANSTFDNDYMSGEETYKYYNDMMWPKRFATCVSVDEAIKLMQS